MTELEDVSIEATLAAIVVSSKMFSYQKVFQSRQWQQQLFSLHFTSGFFQAICFYESQNQIDF